MNESNSLSRLEKINRAATYGLILSTASIIPSLISHIKLPGFITIILWCIQTFCSITLLMKFMQNYHRTDKEGLFSYGVMITLASSLIIAFFNAASYLWLFPQMQVDMATAMNEAMSQIQNLPSESIDALNNIMDNFGIFLFWVTFIKNSIIGLLFSSIISSVIRSKESIFDNKEEDELA